MIQKILNKFQNPYLGMSVSNWFRLLVRNKGIDVDRIPLALFSIIVLLLLAPFRFIASKKRRAVIRSASLSQPPIFIIGHWRSGTTHLHYLMSASGRFGSICHIDAVYPSFCLWLRDKNSLLHKVLKTISFTRLIDNVKFDIDSPAEEELAVANKSLFSFLHGFIFRKRFRNLLNMYALFEGITEKEKAQWAETYHDVLLQSSVCSGGKRLLLKNPFNTAKMNELLSIYPGAKFVYIYRNPFDVFVSTMNMHKKTDCFSLQRISESEMRKNVIWSYGKLHDKFYKDYEKIPEGICSCVKYEDLVRNPIGEMSRVYKEIGLDGFDTDNKGMIEYLESVKNYKKNSFKLGDNERKIIVKEWGEYFRLMGYETEQEPK